jgi:hypothetical protein
MLQGTGLARRLVKALQETVQAVLRDATAATPVPARSYSPRENLAGVSGGLLLLGVVALALERQGQVAERTGDGRIGCSGVPLVANIVDPENWTSS